MAAPASAASIAASAIWRGVTGTLSERETVSPTPVTAQVMNASRLGVRPIRLSLAVLASHSRPPRGRLDSSRSRIDSSRMNPFAPSAAPLSVTVLVLPGSSMLTVASVLDPMRACNRISRGERIAWAAVSTDGAPVELTCGLPLQVQGVLAADAAGDLLIVVAGFDVLRHADRALLARLRRAMPRFAAVAGIEFGALGARGGGGARRAAGDDALGGSRGVRRALPGGAGGRRPLRHRRADRHRRRRLAGLRPRPAPGPLALRRRGGARCGERLRLRRGARGLGRAAAGLARPARGARAAGGGGDPADGGLARPAAGERRDRTAGRGVGALARDAVPPGARRRAGGLRHAAPACRRRAGW